MKKRRNAPRVYLVALLLAWSLGVAGDTRGASDNGSDDDAVVVLTTEDLVKLWISGTPEEQLLQRIRTQSTGFELAPDIARELDVIGFPEALLRAMYRKNTSLRRDRAAEPDAAFVGDGQLLRILLNPQQSKPKKRRLRVYAEMDIALIRQWQLEASSNPHFSDIGVFVACSTPGHVPDGWRNKTPILWDSELMPRHRLLVMHTGAEQGEARARRLGLEGNLWASGDRGVATVAPKLGGRKRDTLIFELPEALETRLSSGVTHDIHVGLALKVGEKFYPWTTSGLEDLMVGDELLELDATIRGLSNPSLDAIDLEFGDQAQRKFRTFRTCRKGCPSPARRR